MPDTPLKRSDFAFELPEELIAQEPTTQRSHSRLLERHRDGRISEHAVAQLAERIPEGSLLIMNDTGVFASRLRARRVPHGGQVEVFLLSAPRDREGGGCEVEALARPARKLKVGGKLALSEHCEVEVIGRRESDLPVFTLAASVPARELVALCQQHGYVPLPPYITRKDDPRPASQSPDQDRYQTVYARDHASVAAPTAGLHFDDALFAALDQRGIERAHVTLHVGAGTFLPVRSDDPAEHDMHSERYLMPRETLEAIKRAQARKAEIIAVGTTSMRATESFLAAGIDCETWAATDLFIYPKQRGDRYRSSVFTGIMTNFHQPESTLFMLISALVGVDEAQAFYREAVTRRLRFFSYGDSSLLWL